MAIRAEDTKILALEVPLVAVEVVKLKNKWLAVPLDAEAAVFTETFLESVKEEILEDVAGLRTPTPNGMNEEDPIPLDPRSSNMVKRGRTADITVSVSLPTGLEGIHLAHDDHLTTQQEGEAPAPAHPTPSRGRPEEARRPSGWEVAK